MYLGCGGLTRGGLLEHYQVIDVIYDQEQTILTSRLEASSKVLDHGRKLEIELGRKKEEVEGVKEKLKAVIARQYQPGSRLTD